MQTLKVVLLSDFNLGNLAGQARANQEQPKFEPELCDYGQLYNVLSNVNHSAWQNSQEKGLFVWASPFSLSQSFFNLKTTATGTWEDVKSDLDIFINLIINASKNFRIVLLSTLVIPHWERVYTNELSENGIRTLLMKMNIYMIDALSRFKNIKFLNTERWLQKAGESAFNSRLWYMAKIPYSNSVFAETVNDIKWHLRSFLGGQRKLVICDLDDTMWGGILGDDGWENLKIGGHDPIGEAHRDLQSTLKSFKDRGILLAIASKNDEATALTAIEKHPEMVLRKTDFVAWKINWKDKAQNILDILSQLNLGAQSAIFLDDNPVERARVREMIPDILVPDMPENKLDYNRTILTLNSIDIGSATEEDLNRTVLYLNERDRENTREGFISLDEWIGTLNMTVEISLLNSGDLPRAAQLLNKTNQLNLRTRRMTDLELEQWSQQSSNCFYTIKVKDRFGDMGLVGLLGATFNNKTLTIEDFVLSCRVMGRKVEETMLWHTQEVARKKGASIVKAGYISTSKNKPVMEFFDRSGWIFEETKLEYSWALENCYPKPSRISILSNL